MEPIERYNQVRDREAEAHLRSPQGERERRIANAKAAIASGGMTAAHWNTLSRAEREAARDMSDVNVQLWPYHERTVRVEPPLEGLGERPMRTFRVGLTTGWKPVLLAMRKGAVGSSNIIHADSRFTHIQEV
jgi:hypothetical protein